MRNEKLILFVLAALQFTHVLDFVIMMPLAPQFMKSFHITPQQFGVMVSIYTIAAGISALVAASFVDKFDRKRVLLFLYAGFIIATLCCALSPNHYFFSIARGLAGAFGGIIGGVTQAIIGDVFPENRRGRATGILSASFSVASILGVPTGIALATLFDWHAPFLALAASSAVVFGMAVYGIPTIRGHLTPSGEIKTSHKPKGLGRFGLWNIVANRNYWQSFAFAASIMLAGMGIIPYISAYMVGNLGVLQTQLPYIYFFGGMATFVTSPMIGRLSDRYGKHHMYLTVGLTSLIPILIMAHLPPLPLPVILMISTVFMITVSGRFVPGMALVVSSVDPRNRGGFMSVVSSLQNLAAGIAAQIGGFLVGSSATEGGALTHFNYVGYFAVIMTVISLALSRRVKIVS